MDLPEGINWHLALIIDGEVRDVIHTEARLAAILMSEPTIVGTDDLSKTPNVGDVYNEVTGTFSPKEG